MRSVPIALDHDTPLDVVYEDSDFVAVNKAVGFHTAPVHRWQGGSIVNMLLAHFSRTAAAGAAAAAAAGSSGSADAAGSCISADAPAAAAAAPCVTAEPSSSAASVVQQQQHEQDKQQQQPRASHVAAVKPYVVHRLDYNTSGLLLFGKRREVVSGVNKQFRCVLTSADLFVGYQGADSHRLARHTAWGLGQGLTSELRLCRFRCHGVCLLICLYDV
jgi:hypothetical protein